MTTRSNRVRQEVIPIMMTMPSMIKYHQTWINERNHRRKFDETMYINESASNIQSVSALQSIIDFVHDTQMIEQNIESHHILLLCEKYSRLF